MGLFTLGNLLGGAALTYEALLARRIARMQKIASTAPAPPSKWPIADVVELIDTAPIASPNSRRTAPSSIVSAKRY